MNNSTAAADPYRNSIENGAARNRFASGNVTQQRANNSHDWNAANRSNNQTYNEQIDQRVFNPIGGQSAGADTFNTLMARNERLLKAQQVGQGATRLTGQTN